MPRRRYYHELMARIILTLFLILNFLACPIRCMTCQAEDCCAGAASVDTVKGFDDQDPDGDSAVARKPSDHSAAGRTGCCSHCSDVDSTIGDTENRRDTVNDTGPDCQPCPDDSAPPHDCDCKNCLCEGAVLQEAAGIDRYDGAELQPMLLTWHNGRGNGQQQAAGAPTGMSAGPPLTVKMPSGRMARILFQSWQN